MTSGEASIRKGMERTRWRKPSISQESLGTNIALLRKQTAHSFVFEVGNQQKENPANNVKGKHMLWVPELHQWR